MTRIGHAMTPFHALRIDTPRLHLRPLRSGDEEALFAIFSDPGVMRYWSTTAWTDRAQAERLVADEVLVMQGREHLRLALTRRDDGGLIGTCSLFKIDAGNRHAEIGYGLGSAWHGQGWMHEALTRLIDLAFDTAPGAAFDDLALNRLEADIDPRNLASARSLQRLGFVPEGLLRERWQVGGEVQDSALYGLLRADWRPHGASA
jgi:[ribosomal protein S5]-alanine N-acetyltransferase